jgi:hypothetical protein
MKNSHQHPHPYLPRLLLKLPLLFLPLISILSAAWLNSAPADAAESYPEIKWEALVPKGWDPGREFKGLDLAKLQDSDPRAMEALDKLKSLWDNAPVEHALNGKKVRIAGFALPLERKGDKVTEFLLVPYFGACVHTPPPPANQIIHARSSAPLAGVTMMQALWVYGTLGIDRAQTDWGVAGYRLQVERVEPYTMPSAKK